MQMREHIKIRGSSGITQPYWVLLLGETPQSTQKNKNTVIYELRIRMLAPTLSVCFFEYIWKTIKKGLLLFYFLESNQHGSNSFL
jgi:hypothetical protein